MTRERGREREMGEDAEERGEIVLGIWLAVKRRRGKSLIRNGILHFEGERERERKKRSRNEEMQRCRVGGIQI